MKTELLGCLEQKIMNILWASSVGLKPGEVQKKLDNCYAYTTVMTVLKRMADKNLVSRHLSGKVFYYSPVDNKEKFIKNNLSGIYDNLVKSYGKLAISQFVDVVKANSEDLDSLKEFLNSKNEK